MDYTTASKVLAHAGAPLVDVPGEVKIGKFIMPKDGMTDPFRVLQCAKDTVEDKVKCAILPTATAEWRAKDLAHEDQFLLRQLVETPTEKSIEKCVPRPWGGSCAASADKYFIEDSEESSSDDEDESDGHFEKIEIPSEGMYYYNLILRKSDKKAFRTANKDCGWEYIKCDADKYGCQTADRRHVHALNARYVSNYTDTAGASHDLAPPIAAVLRGHGKGVDYGIPSGVTLVHIGDIMGKKMVDAAHAMDAAQGPEVTMEEYVAERGGKDFEKMPKVDDMIRRFAVAKEPAKEGGRDDVMEAPGQELTVPDATTAAERFRASGSLATLIAMDRHPANLKWRGTLAKLYPTGNGLSTIKKTLNAKWQSVMGDLMTKGMTVDELVERLLVEVHRVAASAKARDAMLAYFLRRVATVQGENKAVQVDETIYWREE